MKSKIHEYHSDYEIVMSKTKKNKKFYNFTEKQKRRDRSEKFSRNAPADYRKAFNRQRKAKHRAILRKILKGMEAEFARERKNVLWYYL